MQEKSLLKNINITYRHHSIDLAVVNFNYEYLTDATNDLMRNNIAHFPILHRGTDALIGPLIAPGKTPCLKCLEHALNDDDAIDNSADSARFGFDTSPRFTVINDLIASTCVAKICDILTMQANDDAVVLQETSELMHITYPEFSVSTLQLDASQKCGCLKFGV
jgi:hypothetical protein